MTISFPSTTVAIIPAAQSVSIQPQRVLFIGQKLAIGTAIAGELVETIGNAAQEDTLFGAHSMLANLVRVAKRVNGVTQFDAIPLDDAAVNTKAAGIVTFTGAATEVGSITVEILDNFVANRFEVVIENGDTATIIGGKLEALVNASPRIQVTAANVAGVVTLTAENGGSEGNFIPIRVTGEVAGVTIAVTGFTGGTGDPILTTLFDVIEDRRYQTIVWPTAYDRTVVRDFLDGRFNTNNIVLDGVGLQTLVETKAAAIVTGNTLNSQNLALFVSPPVSRALEKSVMNKVNPTNLVAEFGAIRSLRLTDGANITDIVDASRGVLDSIGGPSIASLPYANTPFSTLPIIDQEDRLSLQDVQELKAAGISVLSNNVTNTSIIASRIVTTYKTDVASNPDNTFKPLNFVDTSSVVREFFANNLRNTYRQSRLTNGGIIPGRNMANRASIIGTLEAIYRELVPLALVQEGGEAIRAFRASLVVTLDLALGKVTIQMAVPIVVQVVEIVALMQIVFNVEG